MPNLTVRKLSEEAYERLKLHALENHRSLNQEIISILEQAAARPTKQDTVAVVDDLRKFHQETKHMELSERAVNAAKRSGHGV